MSIARDLTCRLADLLSRERSALADFLVLLADFDQRRLWLELGHASLFSFLHRELRLSRGAAYYRQKAAELVQRHPEVVEPIRDGRLCITSVVELAKVITPDNRGEVLPRFFHCSKQEAAEVAAEIRPQEDAPRRTVITSVAPVGSSVAPAQPTLASSVAADIALAAVQLEGRLDANPGTRPQEVRTVTEPLGRPSPPPRHGLPSVPRQARRGARRALALALAARRIYGDACMDRYTRTAAPAAAVIASSPPSS